MEAIVDAVDELCREGPGDVLVFLPGEREIRDAAEALRKHHPPHTEILPLFARLSGAEQERVFRTSNARRIVLATNVAETSLTVPGIRYVVDTGLARVKRYSYRNKVEQLQIEPISQAAANQRAGRCGRVADGICIRLYDEADFQCARALHRSGDSAFVAGRRHPADEVAAPDGDRNLPVHRTAAGPRRSPTATSCSTNWARSTTTTQLTPLGRELARLPLDPRVGRMILAARDQQSLQRSADHRERAVGAGSARPADRGAGAGRPGAPQIRRRAFRIPAVAANLELVRGRDRAQEVEPATAGRLPRQLPVATAPARMARRAFATADRGAGARLAPERERRRPSSRSISRLLTGLLGNIGLKADDEPYYLGARGIKFYLWPGSALLKKAGQAG